ncbi:MAG: aldehyde dehydrogenase family protein [Pseudomonadota bacterium]
MNTAYLNYIGGEWIPSASGKTFESRNPAHPDQVLGIFQRSNDEDVNRAMAAAADAQTGWAATPAPERGLILGRIAELLEERREDIARTITREMGKVYAEAAGFDTQAAISTARVLMGEGRRLLGQTVPSELPNKFAMVVREPIGVVGAITPWNLPVLLPSWKLFPAILCGNAVVFKPAEDTPLVGTLLVQLLEDAGVPKGVVNMITGYGHEIGDRFVTHPAAQMISFTGSQAVGRIIASKAGGELKKVSLELGSKNAVVVMDDAEFNLALEGALWGGYGTSGQRCTAGSRVIVHDAIFDDFVEAFAERAKAIKLGDGLEDGVQMGPLVNQKQLERVHSYIEIGQQEGGTLVTGGRRLDEEMGGYFYAPTLFKDVTPDMRIAQEEIFGPAVSMMKARSFDHAIELANSTQYGLSFGIYSGDVNRVFAAMSRLETGVVNVNAPTMGVEIGVPFGGVKNSGNGLRESGTAAVDEFTELKSIMVDYSGLHRRTGINEAVTKATST